MNVLDDVTILRVEAGLRGLTGRDLARLAGVHEATVSRVLAGKISSRDTLRRLQCAVHREIFEGNQRERLELAGGPDDPDKAA